MGESLDPDSEAIMQEGVYVLLDQSKLRRFTLIPAEVRKVESL